MNESSRPELPEDGDVAALLRNVGTRPVASPANTASVRAAVEAEWRAAVGTRRRRRQFAGWAAAAGVAVTAVGAWLVMPMLQPEPQVVAAVVRMVGDVEQNGGDGRWTPVAPDRPVVSGTRVRTAANGRAALHLENGVELRLDARTVVAFDGLNVATLSEGGVYVDAGRDTGTPRPSFELDTPAGRVAHLGTQYEARIADGGVRVGVREGRVRLSRASGDILGTAGESLTVRGDDVLRATLAPSATDWQWIDAVTPPFEIEGRSVEDFLIWVARQTGRTVVYTSPAAARQARSVTLRGTVEGLTPDEAVTAVLATTSLQPEIGAERIRIEATAH